MFRRIFLAITIVAAFGAVGLATPNSADAQRWGRGFGGYSVYYGPRPYYGYGVPYRDYYPSRAYYGPQVYYGPTYYRPNYGSYYYGAPDYYYRPAPRVAFRLGF